MRQKGRCSYWLCDAGETLQYTFEGEISLTNYGVTMYAGGHFGQNNSDSRFMSESTAIQPWHTICWVEVEIVQV